MFYAKEELNDHEVKEAEEGLRVANQNLQMMQDTKKENQRMRAKICALMARLNRRKGEYDAEKAELQDQEVKLNQTMEELKKKMAMLEVRAWSAPPSVCS